MIFTRIYENLISAVASTFNTSFIKNIFEIIQSTNVYVILDYLNLAISQF